MSPWKASQVTFYFRCQKIIVKMLLFIFFINHLSAERRLIETIELSYGQFDAYFMDPVEMEQARFFSNLKLGSFSERVKTLEKSNRSL